MAFTVITPGAGLTRAQRRRAAAAGPVAVLTRTSYRSLLRSAGFVDVVAQDVTADYRATLDGWVGETDRRADAVVQAVGQAEFDERRARRLAARTAIDDGVLERWRFGARRP